MRSASCDLCPPFDSAPWASHTMTSQCFLGRGNNCLTISILVDFRSPSSFWKRNYCENIYKTYPLFLHLHACHLYAWKKQNKAIITHVHILMMRCSAECKEVFMSQNYYHNLTCCIGERSSWRADKRTFGGMVRMNWPSNGQLDRWTDGRKYVLMISKVRLMAAGLMFGCMDR